MRISDKMRYDLVSRRVDDVKTANATAMDKLSSQKNIRNLSDDPIVVTQVVKFRDNILNNTQFQKNIEYAKGYLERSEAAMSTLADNLIRAKELAIGMANDTYDRNSRDASSREIREIMDEVVQVANTTFNGRYVFGGFRNSTPPLSLDGEFHGDDGAIYVEISPGNFRQTNLQARGLFEAGPDERERGHFNMVHTLEVLYEGMIGNDKDAIRTAMSELEYQIEKTTSHQATVGSMHNSLSNTHERLEAEEVMMRRRLSEVQDTDFYDATSEFKRTESALQGSLLAATKLLQPSLLNFLQ